MRKIICCLLLTMRAAAQSPVPGEASPDFTLHNVDYYTKKTPALQDFSGKWLILDFWTKGCVTCVESFPKVEELRKEFGNDIQFMLVANNEQRYNKGIRELYERFRVKKDLHLAIAYDSLLFEQFGVTSTPHVVIIRPEGTVEAVTGYSDFTAENIRKMLSGGQPSFYRKYNKFEEDTLRSVRVDTLLQGDAHPYLYRSALARWTRDMPIMIRTELRDDVPRSSFDVTTMSLNRLYNMAYWGRTDWGMGDTMYGRYHQYPVVELKDPSPFKDDFTTAQHLYNYSMTMPVEKATPAARKAFLQSDLQKFFGYTVHIEQRMMPCYYFRMLRTPKPSKGGGGMYGDHSGFKLKNTTAQGVLQTIWAYHQFAPPMIDETNFNGRFDIDLDALMTDLEELRKVLLKNGFALEKGEKLMNVLVIKDVK